MNAAHIKGSLGDLTGEAHTLTVNTYMHRRTFTNKGESLLSLIIQALSSIFLIHT